MAAETFMTPRGAPGGDDYHRIWINPDHPEIMLIATDQGAIVTVNDGETWSSWYNQPTAQMYHVTADNAFPYRVCSGQQESGSACVNSRSDFGAITYRDWTPVGVTEYGYVAPDPLDPDIGSTTSRRCGRSRRTELRPVRTCSSRENLEGDRAPNVVAQDSSDATRVTTRPVGPSVLPGRYTVRLTVNGQTQTQPLVVTMDPRVTTSQAELQRQFALSTKLAGLLRQDFDALEEVRALRAATSDADLDTTAAALESSLERLNGDLSSLYGIVEGADVGPTSQVVEATGRTERALLDTLARWAAIEKP